MDLAPASRGVSPLRHAPCLGLSPPTPSLETPRTGNCLPSISTDEEFGHGCLAGLGAVLTRWGAAFPTSRNETSGHLRLSAMADVAGLPSITLAQSCQTPLGKHGAKRCAHTRLHKKKKTALRAASFTFLKKKKKKRRCAPPLLFTLSHALRATSCVPLEKNGAPRRCFKLRFINCGAPRRRWSTVVEKSAPRRRFILPPNKKALRAAALDSPFLPFPNIEWK